MLDVLRLEQIADLLCVTRMRMCGHSSLIGSSARIERGRDVIQVPRGRLLVAVARPARGSAKERTSLKAARDLHEYEKEIDILSFGSRGVRMERDQSLPV